MKKLLGRLLLCLIPVLLYLGLVYGIDTYNVFHPDNIRVTAAKSNSNFIKTRYVLKNPERYNAFVLGSSRSGNLPLEGLPREINGTALNWYNMNGAMASLKADTEMVKTFIRGGVDIRYLVLEIDEISMYQNYQANVNEKFSTPYQEYEKSPVRFYYEYLKLKPELSLLKDVLFPGESAREKRATFYEQGVFPENLDMTVPEGERKMFGSLGTGSYETGDGNAEPIAALRELTGLCEERGIALVVLTSPVVESTYEEAAGKGYYAFLKDVAAVTPYYNFSGLSEYTTDARYYFDASHFRPYVGRQMERIIFEEDRTEDVNAFGAYITKDNIDELISRLQSEMP